MALIIIYLINLSSRLGDIKHSCADITPLKSLGYKPKYSIEEGITAYLTYNKHNNINI